MTDGAEKENRRWHLAIALTLAGGAVLWGAGFLLAWLAGWDATGWNALWGLTGVSFLGAVVLPLPGSTSALLATLEDQPVLAGMGVLGAAIGGTVGAGLLLGLGDLGRKHLRKRAQSSKWRRKVLEWGEKLSKRWTYLGVGLLLLPPFIPRSPVLYAASVAQLKALPHLATVFLATLGRNLLVLATVYGLFKGLGL